MKKYSTILIIILTVALLAGCSTKPAEDPDVITIKAGADMAYAPFEYVNDAGKPEGFDMDLIRAIADEMGFNVELVNTNWDGIIPSLETGNIDLIISAMTITEERKESVTFSDPYFESTQYIAVKEGSSITSLADLKGKKVGVQNGTTGDFAITEYYDGLEEATEAGTVQRYADIPAALTELINGGVDAVVADSPVVLEFIASNPNANIIAFGDDSFEKEFFGIAMRQDDTDIHAMINEGLEKIKENGVYDEVFGKYFSTGN